MPGRWWQTANVNRYLALLVIVVGDGVYIVLAFTSHDRHPHLKIIHRRKKWSNSSETLLSIVNWRTDTKFLIKFGAWRTLFSIRGGWGVSKCILPRPWIGTEWPFPSMILLFLLNLNKTKDYLGGCHVRGGTSMCHEGSGWARLRVLKAFAMSVGLGVGVGMVRLTILTEPNQTEVLK